VKISLVLILTIFIFSCSKEVSDKSGVSLVEDTGGIGTISEPPVTPVVTGKKRIIISNRKDESDASSKKDSSGYDQEGAWSQSTLLGYKDSISRYSSDPSAQVTYSTSKVSSARYCVSVFQVTHTNSISEAKYEIYDDNIVIDTKTLSPKKSENEKGWAHLGIYSFPSETGKVVLTRGDSADGGFLRADELRFLRLKDGFDCYGRMYKVVKKNAVIDNRKDINDTSSKKDTVGYRESGVWEQSTLSGFQDKISRYSFDTTGFVTYQAKIFEDKDYCLKFFKVVHANSSIVEVSITVNDVVLQVSDYDLSTEAKGWESLGIHSFQKNDIVKIQIKRVDANDGKVLRADAVRFLSNVNSCS
jgi:hypothetical protein